MNIELWEIRKALRGQLVVLLRKFEIAVSFWRRWSGMIPATIQKLKSVKDEGRLSHSLSSNMDLLQIAFSVKRRCGPCGDLAAVGRLGFEIEQRAFQINTLRTCAEDNNTHIGQNCPRS